MDNETLKEAMLNGLYAADYSGHELLTPKMLVNANDQHIWTSLKQELKTCKSFIWSVAFITLDMLTPLKVVLADLYKKGIRGKIVTSTYLNFNQPKVFTELLKLKNVDVYLAEESGFHVKGYMFEHSDYYTMIVGSANFTRAAMLSNYEWAIKLTSTGNGSLYQQTHSELERIIENSQVLTQSWIDNYKEVWQNLRVTEKSINNKAKSEIVPNKMQMAALKELEKIVAEKKSKALVVSATGTGKTYLGAFAVKEYQPKRFLFVVHREQIAKKAMESFKKVIGGSGRLYGMLSGDRQDTQAKYIFSTIQTVSQDKILDQLPSNYFDYILIDEAHRSAAPSYQKIMHHFKPDFCLGMTATPERMDNQDVYALFDYNLAYEIRLRDALENKMLSPFHYIGVQDYEEDGIIVDETTNLRYLTAPKRVKYILDQLDYYGYSGLKVHGLVFCSRQDEALELAQAFTDAGHQAKALTNQDSNERRRAVVRELEEGKIEYIITVNLFNEGIDIPCVNQVVMLRNTQSSIVFIQQLGRGLRKYPGKDFVTVLDFIGNYKNNYLIPIALTQDNSRSIDEAKAELRVPPVIDVSTINFTEIAQEKILQSLDKVKLDSMKELRTAYQDLKNKLGKVPLLQDFYRFGSVSPIVFANNGNLDNYDIFLQKMGEDSELNLYQEQVLTFITKELLNGMRPHELILLDLLTKNKVCSLSDYEQELQEKQVYFNMELMNSVENILNLSFFDVKAGKTTKAEQYGGIPIVEKVNLLDYQLNDQIKTSLNNPKFYQLWQDVIQTGLLLNEEYQNKNQFTFYQKYTRKDVCRLLNWEKDVSAPMYGYRVGEKECPIFITYKKDSEDRRNAKYRNDLQNGKSLRWYTRSPRHIDSDEVQRLLAKDEMGNYKIKLHLFVKRSDADGKGFYYLGEGKIVSDSVREEIIGKKTAVGMNIELQHPLETKMYDLLFTE